MEMCAEFYGSVDGAFFDFDSVSKNRHIKYPMLPNRLASKLGNSQSVVITRKQRGEVRILSADIALMSSKKNHNDATAIFINCMTPTKSGRYINNIVYTNNYEGLRTDDQALIIRKLYDEYECDYIVLDTNGKLLPACTAMYGIAARKKTGSLRRRSDWKAISKKYSHRQRIGCEPEIQNIINPRVRTI